MGLEIPVHICAFSVFVLHCGLDVLHLVQLRNIMQSPRERQLKSFFIGNLSWSFRRWNISIHKIWWLLHFQRRHFKWPINMTEICSIRPLWCRSMLNAILGAVELACRMHFTTAVQSVTAVIFNEIEAIFTPNQIGPINMVWPMNISHTHLPPWNRASVTFKWATKIDRNKEWRKEQQFFTLFAQCYHDNGHKRKYEINMNVLAGIVPVFSGFTRIQNESKCVWCWWQTIRLSHS